MNNLQIINYLDNITYKKTSRHFNDLQSAILEGVLNGDKYSDIAKRYNCTTGNINDKASELWQLLTNILGERINRTNLKTTIRRRMNNSSLDNSNLFYSMLMEEDAVVVIEKTIESVKIQTKLLIGSRLKHLGLSCEQIAGVLDLPLKLILGFLDNLENLDDLPE
jgi:hypothetical protein